MASPGITIHAVIDGETHHLNTTEAMRRWFSAPAPGAEYFATRLGVTYEFDGVEGGEPRSPSHLVSQALSRLPGNACRGNRHDWSLFDDMTRGQCAWLATELAKLTGGTLIACGIDEPKYVDSRNLAWFMHAGVLIGQHVYCALGRMTPTDWSRYVTRCSSKSRFGPVDPIRLAVRQIAPLSARVAKTLPDVANLIATLIHDEDEPRHCD